MRVIRSIPSSSRQVLRSAPLNCSRIPAAGRLHPGARAQHASLPVGAGPPQHVLGAACVWVVDAPAGASGVMVCVRVASDMSVSSQLRRSHFSPLHFRRRTGPAEDATVVNGAASRLLRRSQRRFVTDHWNRRTTSNRGAGNPRRRAGGQHRPRSIAGASP